MVVVEACLDLRLQPCAEAVAAAVAAALLDSTAAEALQLQDAERRAQRRNARDAQAALEEGGE